MGHLGAEWQKGSPVRGIGYKGWGCPVGWGKVKFLLQSMVIGTTLWRWVCCSTVVAEEKVDIVRWVFFAIVLMLVEVSFQGLLVPSVFPLVPPVLTEEGVEAIVMSTFQRVLSPFNLPKTSV